MYEYCTVPELLVLVPYYLEIVLSTARVRIQVLVLVRTSCRDAAYEYSYSYSYEYSCWEAFCDLQRSAIRQSRPDVR